jgi:hypothetical protein
MGNDAGSHPLAPDTQGGGRPAADAAPAANYRRGGRSVPTALQFSTHQEDRRQHLAAAITHRKKERPPRGSLLASGRLSFFLHG